MHSIAVGDLFAARDGFCNFSRPNALCTHANTFVTVFRLNADTLQIRKPPSLGVSPRFANSVTSHRSFATNRADSSQFPHLLSQLVRKATSLTYHNPSVECKVFCGLGQKCCHRSSPFCASLFLLETSGKLPVLASGLLDSIFKARCKCSPVGNGSALTTILRPNRKENR